MSASPSAAVIDGATAQKATPPSSSTTSATTTGTGPAATVADTKAITIQTQQSEPLSSSYANIVQKDSHDKDKTNATAKNRSVDVATKKSTPTASNVPSNNNNSNKHADKPKESVAAAHESNNEITTSKSHAGDVDDATLDAEDDSTFTPVVSHNRKDRNSRRNKDQTRGNGATVPSSNGGGRQTVTGSNKSQRQPRSENGRSKEATHKRSKANRDDKDKTMGQSDATASGTTQHSGDSNTSAKTTPPTSEAGIAGADDTNAHSTASTDAAKKFIEAPLPKVNAWKVSFTCF